jgi:Cu-processing system permease protein
MTTAPSPRMDRTRPPPGVLSNIGAVAGRELRDALRSRWFVLYSLALGILGLGISFLAASGTGFGGMGRTMAGLTNLVLLIVPLMAMTAGGASIASDRERGMLSYLLSQPVSRLEVLVGKYVGLSVALVASIALGLGACALILAAKGVRGDPRAVAWLAGLSVALAMGMLSVGMLVSVLARRSSVAIGTVIFLWLLLVFVSDLGLMAGAIAMRLRIQELFALSLINPLQVFKMWSLYASEASLDVLGPAGLYATDELGSRLHAVFGACLGAWVVLPLMLAGVLFARRSVP